ncbi:MAG: hypothetical protein A2W93_13560 [Bacteroidetes bacterium GWF2_43_63]|nr:MAG: hypothetical protein A2W94_03755 [Bacteroidetes bacterium GWE2_42_42]OFY55017.1 MAG: hypothetical protein A2W93_13560 [Bacteroidetes bacterium GWF2_43_63]HBG69552.1 hypothetical protein [Bacteroidales bacterium]HCB60709.1 hypothetical protein [Bacteroidales bacterium]HCY23987.1 hypothetical protein [Bacteroidales bacterium]
MNNKTYTSPPEQEDDPFLRDAQEGWAQFPGAQSRWWKKKLQFNLFLFGKSWSVLPAAGKLAIGTLSSVAIITVAAVTIPFNFNNDKQELAQQEKTTQTVAPAEEVNNSEDLLQEPALAEESTGKTTPEQTISGESENQMPVVYDRSENLGFYSIEDNDLEADQMMAGDKDMESTNRMNPLQAKKVKADAVDEFTDALPYIWINQYRFLDYDALNADIPQTTVTSTTGSLDTRFSNHEEKKEMAASVAMDTIPYKTFVSDAVVKVKEGNFPVAEYQFKKLLIQRPADENALFYLGYCSYQQGNYTQALSYFDKTKNTTFMAFASDADWYTARIYLLTGERSKAKTLLRKIERSHGDYTEEAQELLQKEFDD